MGFNLMYADKDLNLTSVTVPLGPHNMPKCPMMENDGATWLATVDEFAEGNGFRWRPLNWIAFGKEKPTGELFDHVPWGAQ